MARPKKEKELTHKKQIMLRLTELEHEIVSENAKNAGITVAEYARRQVTNKSVTVKYEIVADVPELKKRRTVATQPLDSARQNIL